MHLWSVLHPHLTQLSALMIAYRNDVLPWMVRGDQLLPVVIQLGDGGLLGLQTLADEVLLG